MTIDILIEALEMYRDRGGHPDYKKGLIHDSIGELRNLCKQGEYELEHWNGAIHPVHTGDLLAFANCTLYDEFGKMMRGHCGDLPFQVFYEDLLYRRYDLHLSFAAARACYEYLCDLWTDNERYEQNAEDGTFKRPSK